MESVILIFIHLNLDIILLHLVQKY